MTTGGGDDINPGRRRHPRFAVEVEAEISIEGQLWAAKTRDLSRGGMCFLLPGSLEMGTTFDVKLSLLGGEARRSETLALGGSVVWCTPTPNGCQIGAAFTQMTADSQQNLESFLHVLAEGVAVDKDSETS